MRLHDIYVEAARQLGYPVNHVEKVYKSYWETVREYVSALPLKDDLTDEEFLALRPNVNIPSLGKLYVTLEKYKAAKYLNRKLLEMGREKQLKNEQDVTD